MIYLIKLVSQIIIIYYYYSKALFAPQVEVDTSVGIGSEFSVFVADTLEAPKEMYLSRKHLAEVHGRGQAGRKTPFLNPAFYTELFRRKLYQTAFQHHTIHLAEVIQ